MSDDEPRETDESGSSKGTRATQSAQTSARENTAERPDFVEGRYLYCLVALERSEPDQPALDVDGVAGNSVSVVRAGEIGAVVHPCDELYDSSDLTTVRRWLVRHQSVVDEAADSFGTPLPFQFDTILRGDDAAVRGWLERERDRLAPALADLAGHWEYRIDVREHEPVDEAQLRDRDDRLAELAREIDAADPGTAFLREKQYDNRVTDLRRTRRNELTADVIADLEPIVRALETLDDSPAATLSDADELARDDDAATVCRLAILAHETREDEVGAVLDEVAAIDGLEVRFTGPWAPYSFAPTLGTDESATDGG